MALAALLSAAWLLLGMADRRTETAFREQFIPRMLSASLLEGQVGDVSVEWLRGRLLLRDLSVTRPPTDERPGLRITAREVEVHLRRLPLLNGRVHISSGAVRGADVTVVLAGRGGSGDRRANGGRQPDPAPLLPPPHRRAARNPGPSAVPPEAGLRMDRLTLQGSLRLVDYSAGADAPLDLRLTAAATVRDATLGGSEPPSAAFRLLASEPGDRHRFATDLHGRFERTPGYDAYSFDLRGSISNATREALAPYLTGSDLRFATLDAELALACRAGAYDPGASVIAAVLHDTQLGAAGPAAGHTAVSIRRSRLALRIPVSGPIGAPQLNVDFALLQALSQPDAEREAVPPPRTEPQGEARP
jgi:hypothetical protein